MFRKVKKRHSSSSSQSSEISTKSKVSEQHAHSHECYDGATFSSCSQRSRVSDSTQSVDSSLGGLSRSSTVASLDTDSTKSSGQSTNTMKSSTCCFFPLLTDYSDLRPRKGNGTSETCAEFRVKYVGAIEKLQFDMSRSLQEPLDLINYIDAAQVRSCRDTLCAAVNITSFIFEDAINIRLLLAARWKAALRAPRRRGDSGSVKVWSQGGLAGPVCEWKSDRKSDVLYFRINAH